jgi:Zn-dependent peptidase ImmA (M78 family)
MIQKLPTQITLAGIDIRVVVDNDMRDEVGLRLGRADYESQTIFINTNAVPEDSVWQAFYHEVFHYIFHTLGRHDMQNDEMLVDQLGSMMYQLQKTARVPE